MVNAQMALGRVLPFPTPEKKQRLQTGHVINRILACKDDLLTALEVLRDSFNAILGETPSRDADEILAKAEAAVQQAHNVMANVAVTTAKLKNLRAMSQKPLPLFPPSGIKRARSTIKKSSAVSRKRAGDRPNLCNRGHPSDDRECR
jgi:argininosuccinate lyase